jgi:hypothetical protein
MNLSIFLTVLGALVAGLAGGSLYTREVSVLPEPTGTSTAMDAVIAEDYISLRPALVALASETISDAEKADLVYMREEEKLARDVYQTLYQKWNLPIFANIAQSEQTHTEAVKHLLDKYEIIDPVINDSIGVFENKELQSLFVTLTERGLKSETEALMVGAMIEELDIKDIATALTRTDNQDVRLVYENLMRGSRNHLRAFTKQLSARDMTYKPQYISMTEYDRILEMDTERGNMMGQKGGGRGWGGQ